MTLDYFYGQAGELFSFFRIPKALFQEQRFQNLSTDAKTLYGILLDRMSLSVKNEWFDKKGRVFIIFTIEDVKRTLCCADNKATRLLRELEEFGLIERKRRGQGKPCLVYVKNFSSESSKESVKNRDNDDSCGSKIACQDPVKSRGIKKKENKTEMNNTNLILSDESEKMKNRELLEEYFSHSIEIDLLLRLYPDDEDTLYQIVNLLVDTCDSKRKLIRIAGDDKPAEVVCSRLKKLNADHIRFVLNCLAENTSPIRNMKQYLLAALFNAPTSQRSSILSARNDMANTVRAVFQLAGADVTFGEGYPGWKPNPHSAILEVAAESYKRLFGVEAKVKAIHAGLECGLFLDKYPTLDMISFGPTLTGVHSPDERMHIPSVEKFWKHLLDILAHVPAKK